MIAQVQQQCATATVHAVPYWRVREGPYLFGPNESVALRIGLDQVADAFAINLQPDGSRKVSSDCPTILWVEHYDYRQTTTAKVIAASALTLDPTSSLRANAQVGETGFILVIPPPESRSAARP